MQVGEKTVFGRYEWRVLDIQNNAALIITEDIVEKRPYHNVYKDTTWADCALRKYLNGEFYDAFDTADKSSIISVTNKTWTIRGLAHVAEKIHKTAYSC